jgi:hypothetical protein
MQRARQLHHAHNRYHARANGRGSATLRAAMERAADFLSSPADLLASIPQLPELAERLFPEKAAYAGKPALEALCRQVRADALRLQLPAAGSSILLVLKFLFGHNCLEDPLYPWIRQALAQKLPSPSARCEQLAGAAAAWIEQSMPGLQKGATA